MCRAGPNSKRGLGSAALTLWYEAGPAWEPLRETPEWIELGVSTCNYDWSADRRNPTWLTSELERSPVFKIAWSERALAMTAGFSDENADGSDQTTSWSSLLDRRAAPETAVR